MERGRRRGGEHQSIFSSSEFFLSAANSTAKPRQQGYLFDLKQHRINPTIAPPKRNALFFCFFIREEGEKLIKKNPHSVLPAVLSNPLPPLFPSSFY